MKNCIEHPGYLRRGVSFSADTGFAPERRLPGVHENPETDQWTNESTPPVSQRVARRRTQSESLAEGTHALLRQTKSSQSFDLSGVTRSCNGNSYLLLIGEENGKTSVIVYGLRNKRILQKFLDTGKRNENLRGACCGFDDDAPFLYFFHCSKKHAMDLVAYDVLEGKWKTRACPKSKCEFCPVINMGTCIACFRRNSDSVERFNIVKNKWEKPIQLLQAVDLPVVVKFDDNIYYIFSGNTVQRYDVLIEKLTSWQVTEYISMGFGLVLKGTIYILSDASLVQFDTHSGNARRFDFPHLQYHPIHTAVVRYGHVFVLRTNSAGKYEILSSQDLVNWEKLLSFPKRLNLICTEVVDYIRPCPFAPFETFDESIKMPKFTLS